MQCPFFYFLSKYAQYKFITVSLMCLGMCVCVCVCVCVCRVELHESNVFTDLIPIYPWKTNYPFALVSSKHYLSKLVTGFNSLELATIEVLWEPHYLWYKFWLAFLKFSGYFTVHFTDMRPHLQIFWFNLFWVLLGRWIFNSPVSNFRSVKAENYAQL
jgi:hypothetical protein